MWNVSPYVICLINDFLFKSFPHTAWGKEMTGWILYEWYGFDVLKLSSLLRSAVDMTHVLRSRLVMDYSLFQKKRTFISDFFRGPPGRGGPKIHLVDYVISISTLSLKRNAPWNVTFLLRKSVDRLTLQCISFCLCSWSQYAKNPFKKCSWLSRDTQSFESM